MVTWCPAARKSPAQMQRPSTPRGKKASFGGGMILCRRLFVTTPDADSYDEQLRSDSYFLRSDPRMDTDLVDTLVLQLNRIYPQILSDKEAHRFRNLSVSTAVRLAELLNHLHGKGEDACYEFYRGLHIHAEHVYFSLPSRVSQREAGDANCLAVHPLQDGFNDRGPAFFLSCFSFVLGIAMLYYNGEGETLRCTGPFLHCSAVRLSRGARDVLVSLAEV